MAQELNYVKMKLSELNPAKYNPRKITDEAMQGLENSLDEFGLVQPIVWNSVTGNIVGGHQRYTALRSKGVDEAMVCQVSLSLKKEKALNITLNNKHISGDFDDGLAELLGEIRDDDIELFRDVHLDKLLEEEPGGNSGEDDVPEVAEVAVSKPGDVWILGDHRLMCGSSTEHGDVMKLVEDRHAQCMWTDPPYGVDYQSNPGAYAKQGKAGAEKHAKAVLKPITNDGKENALKVLGESMKLAFDYVVAPGSGIYVFTSAGELLSDFCCIIRESGFLIRQSLIWYKENNFSMGRQDYQAQHEFAWYAMKPGDEQFGRMGKIGWHGPHNASTVFKHDKAIAKNELHPTMKPVAIIVAMLKNSTRPLDWVYEPFAGSSTTLIACEQLGRRCMAMELDPLYCDVGVLRWQEQTGGHATLESTGETFDSIKTGGKAEL